MTLPAWRDEPVQRKPRQRFRGPDELKEIRDRRASPANQLLELLENADLPGVPKPPRPAPQPEAQSQRFSRKFAGWLLGWSVLAMGLSFAYLTYETLNAAPAAPLERPALDFSGVQSRYVMSTEGPALELSGVLRNDGETMIEPDVLLQLAGGRLAIEEPLRLGGAALPPGAERPFTVRVLLPEGVRSVRLLPPEQSGLRPREMALISPAWTAQ